MPIYSGETRTQFLGPTNNPDTFNQATLYAPGQIGQKLPYSSGYYQCVQDDSGNTSANTVGVVAANQLAFWKDPVNYVVTNDLRFSQNGRNGVAGIFRTAVTAGYYCFVLQKGDGISVKCTTGAVGDSIIANSGTGAAATVVTAGTASTYAPLGYAKAASDGTNISANLNIPSAP